IPPLAPPAVASTMSAEELEALWVKLVEAVGRASPFVRGYFTAAHPVALAKNLLTIGFDPEFVDQIKLVDNSKNHALLQTKLSELGHPNLQVKFIEHQGPEKPVMELAPAAAVP